MFKIAVIFTDGTFQVVSADELNVLLKKREIQSFLRSDCWVRVGFDMLRGDGSSKQYAGNDRRKHENHKRSHCDCCGKEIIAASGGSSIYSVIVENDGFSLQIIEGELIHGAYHYCSDICMFRREQGTVCIDRLAPELLLWGAG